MKINAGNLQKNDFIEMNGQIVQIVVVEHNFHGRGSANYRFKLKNVKTGGTTEYTCKPDNSMEKVGVETILMQYLFSDGSMATFMNDQTYDQYQIPVAVVGEYLRFFKEGQQVYVLLHDSDALAIRPPQVVRLKVTESEKADKGNTTGGAKKPVVLETGVTVMAPIFIKQGETIAVNPENGEYIERVT